MRQQPLHKINELLEALPPIRDELENFANTLQRIANVAQAFFNADSSAIIGINPITKVFLTPFIVTGAPLTEISLYHEQTIQQEVLQQNGDVHFFVSVEEVPEPLHSLLKRERIHSFVVLTFSTKKRQEPLGVLYLYFQQQEQLSPARRELFHLFVNQVSFLLQEAWLLKRYQAVALVGKEINQQLNSVESLVQKLKHSIGDILDIRHAFLLADYQPQTNAIDVYLEEEGRAVRVSDKPLNGACRYVIETKKTLFIEHYSQETLPFEIDYITGTGHEEAFIYVPLVFRDVPLGVLSIQHLQPNTYDQEELSIVELLANHVALALHNMRLYDSLHQLTVIGRLLTQQPDSEQVLQDTADKIKSATRADIVVLYPYSLAAKQFTLPHASGKLLDETTRPLMSPTQPDDIAYLLLTRRKPIFAPNSLKMYADLLGESYSQQGRFVQREDIRSTAAIPLRVGDDAVGVLFINFRVQQDFDATRKLFIEGLANYVAIALQNARVFDELIQRRIREQKIIQNIDYELSHFLDLKSVLDTSLKLIQKEIPADEVSILLYDKKKQILEIPAALGPHSEERKNHILLLKDMKAITLWVVEHKESARVDNVRKDPPWSELYFSITDETTSELDVPLLDDGEVVGILNFESYKEGAFSQKDEDFLKTLAGQIVVAIKRAQAYERESRLSKEHEALKDISKEIMSQFDDKSIFDLILEKALELTNSPTGTLELYDPDKNDLWMAAGRGVDESKKAQRLKLNEGVVGQVAAFKEPLNVDPSLPKWNNIYVPSIRGTRSELAVPMLEGQELRGVINIESPKPNNYTEQDIRLLQDFATLAIVALQHAGLIKERQEAEQRVLLMDEMKSVGEYAFELTHQLGNDLGLVETYVSDIRSELEAQGVVINDVVARKLKNISRSVRNVLEISGKMKSDLARSRVDEAQADAPSAVQPAALLAEVQATIAIPNNISLRVDVDPDTTRVWIIHNLVISILHNLVNNAFQAMPNGGTVTLQASNEGNDGRFVAIRVTDTGIGIPEQRKAKIFDLLYSTKNSSGFGLWNARRNALRNHGELSVEESIMGQGTTFKLLLPTTAREK